jgi:hypothetical protein
MFSAGAPDARVSLWQTVNARRATEADVPLLLAITTTLHKKGVRILRSEVLTVAGQAHDEFDLVDWDGSPLTPQRKAVIIESVTATLVG